MIVRDSSDASRDVHRGGQSRGRGGSGTPPAPRGGRGRGRGRLNASPVVRGGRSRGRGGSGTPPAPRGGQRRGRGGSGTRPAPRGGRVRGRGGSEASMVRRGRVGSGMLSNIRRDDRRGRGDGLESPTIVRRQRQRGPGGAGIRPVVRRGRGGSGTPPVPRGGRSRGRGGRRKTSTQSVLEIHEPTARKHGQEKVEKNTVHIAEKNGSSNIWYVGGCCRPSQQTNHTGLGSNASSRSTQCVWETHEHATRESAGLILKNVSFFKFLFRKTEPKTILRSQL
ncbi:unnamed protein product [Caenorhabditis brenneri]